MYDKVLHNFAEIIFFKKTTLNEEISIANKIDYNEIYVKGAGAKVELIDDYQGKFNRK